MSTELHHPDVGADARIRIDRIRCTGHGICAQTLPGRFRLDEWGYPVVRSDLVGEEEGRLAVKLCPSRALALLEGPR
jgi:ferredoxin